MPLADLLNVPCTITHRTAGSDVDAYGNEIPDEDLVETVCELQQQRRDESEDRGEISRTTWLLILPHPTAIATGDTVTVDDVDYEVHGEPWKARNPRTRIIEHIEATLVRTAGADEDASEAS